MFDVRRKRTDESPGDVEVDRGFLGGTWSGERLLAALALQVVHGVDRNRVTANAVGVIHGRSSF